MRDLYKLNGDKFIKLFLDMLDAWENGERCLLVNLSRLCMYSVTLHNGKSVKADDIRIAINYEIDRLDKVIHYATSLVSKNNELNTEIERLQLENDILKNRIKHTEYTVTALKEELQEVSKYRSLNNGSSDFDTAVGKNNQTDYIEFMTEMAEMAKSHDLAEIRSVLSLIGKQRSSKNESIGRPRNTIDEEEVKYLCKNGMTQSAVAKKFGVSRQLVNSIVNGKRDAKKEKYRQGYYK